MATNLTNQEIQLVIDDDEIRAIQAWHPTENDPLDFARAIIAATVAKLTAGVRVEPVAFAMQRPDEPVFESETKC